jgi:hypothetical protein
METTNKAARKWRCIDRPHPRCNDLAAMQGVAAVQRDSLSFRNLLRCKPICNGPGWFQYNIDSQTKERCTT